MRPARSALAGDDRRGCAIIEHGAANFCRRQRLEIEAGDQRLDTNAVVTLAGQEDKANEIAEGINQSHDFGGETAGGLRPDFESPFCAGAMLVDPDERATDDRRKTVR
jgi:hypothetical protein